MVAKERRYKKNRSIGNVDMEKDGTHWWTEKIANEEVLRRVGEKRSMVETIVRRKKNWIIIIIIIIIMGFTSGS